MAHNFPPQGTNYDGYSTHAPWENALGGAYVIYTSKYIFLQIL